MLEQPHNLIPFVTGIAFVLVSAITRFRPPKKINLLYGYRTTRSMKNQQNWDLAQQLASKYFGIAGVMLIFAGLILRLTEINSGTSMIIAITMVFLSVIVPFVLVEKKLKY